MAVEPPDQRRAFLKLMGKPLMPTAEQWDTLRDASELCYYATPGGGSNSWTVMFPQNTYSASLIELRRE